MILSSSKTLVAYGTMVELLAVLKSPRAKGSHLILNFFLILERFICPNALVISFLFDMFNWRRYESLKKCPVLNTFYLFRMGNLTIEISASSIVRNIRTNNYQNTSVDEFIQLTHFMPLIFFDALVFWCLKRSVTWNGLRIWDFVSNNFPCHRGSSKLLNSWPLSHAQQIFCWPLIENLFTPWKILLVVGKELYLKLTYAIYLFITPPRLDVIAISQKRCVLRLSN